MRHAFVRILKVVVALAGGLVGLAVVLALALLLFPQIVFNPRVIGWGARLAGGAGLDVRWSDLDASVAPRGLLTRAFRLEARDLCVRKRDESLRSCFDSVRLARVADLNPFRFRVREIGPMALRGGEVSVKPSGKEEPAKKEEPEPGRGRQPFALPSFVREAKLRPVRIEVNRWDLAQADGRMTGALDLRAEQADPDLRVRIDASERAEQRGAPSHHGRIQLVAATPAGDLMGPWKIDLKAEGGLPNGLRAGLDARLRQRGRSEAADFDLRADYRQGKRRARARLTGEGAGDRVRATLSATARGFAPRLRELAVRRCELQAGRWENEARGGRVRVDCPIRLEVPLPPMREVPHLKLPSRFGLTLRADVRTQEVIPSAAGRVDGQVRLELDPVLQPVLEGRGHVQTDLAGVPARFPEDWKLDTSAQLTAAIPEFRRVVDLLRGTGWAVPAPFNTLGGRVEFQVNGDLDMQGGRVPVRFDTRLASRDQSIRIDGSGQATVRREAERGVRTHLDLGLSLADVRLALPRLDLAKPPRFFPDSRLTRPKEKEKQLAGRAAPAPESAFTYAVRVDTPPGQPVQLLSNLAKTPIPIDVHVTMESGGVPTGTVAVRDFPLEFFHRDAAVDHFTLALKPDGAREVNGEVKVEYVDYTIEVLVLGSAEKPQIKLVSDPPLPEEQIAAALLFGQPIEELDPDQTESLGQVRSALANRAIGLASLYLLASTPIQSVGYDPSTGVFSAKVRLAQGTSLTVGADAQELSSVGVRRRLGPSWTVGTGIEKNEEGGQTVTAQIEWNHRY